jgi:hypothetical protein
VTLTELRTFEKILLGKYEKPPARVRGLPLVYVSAAAAYLEQESSSRTVNIRAGAVRGAAAELIAEWRRQQLQRAVQAEQQQSSCEEQRLSSSIFSIHQPSLLHSRQGWRSTDRPGDS